MIISRAFLQRLSYYNVSSEYNFNSKKKVGNDKMFWILKTFKSLYILPGVLWPDRSKFTAEAGFVPYGLSVVLPVCCLINTHMHTDMHEC